MGQYTIMVTPTAREQLAAIHHSGNHPMIKKIERLMRELSEHPRTGLGQPEALRHLPGIWSRRLSKRDRIVYRIQDDVVIVDILSMLGHYDDK